MDLNSLIKADGCSCGKAHTATVKDVIVENGAVKRVPEFYKKLGGTRAFILADKNTYKAAGEAVCSALDGAGLKYTKYVFAEDVIEPDEYFVGNAAMHYDAGCDLIIGVGSGVVNDICKILSNISKNPYIIVATAPSMDGYASSTSSMSRDGLKVSVPSRCADVVIGDIDVVKNAPMRMLQSGLGDMLAKYVSICEWRIANLILGEYYCPEVAELVRTSLKKCTDNADGLLKRDETAVKAVFEGLTVCGLAMTYAGLSRPASGVEHYFSHIWDMRGLEFGTSVDTHGIQCAIGTHYAAGLYEKIRVLTPDRNKALAYAENFSKEKWASDLREFLGKGAETMIALEEKERKYGVPEHKERLEKIIGNWDKIIAIIDEEVPKQAEIDRLMDTIGAPKTCDEIGIDSSLLPGYFAATKDIRDKYVLSRLAWDLGIIDELEIK